MKDAHRALKDSGASRAGALAALAGLEPEAVELARELLHRGVQEEILFDLLRGAADPGAALVRELLKVGGISRSTMVDVAMRRVGLPLLRGLAGEEEVRTLRRDGLKVVEERLAKREPVSDDDLAVFAATSAAPRFLKGIYAEDVRVQASLIEAMLRRKALVLHRWRWPAVRPIYMVSLLMGFGFIYLTSLLRPGSNLLWICLVMGLLALLGGAAAGIIIQSIIARADGFLEKHLEDLKKQYDRLFEACERGLYADAERGLEGLLDITRAHLGPEHSLYQTSLPLYAYVLTELRSDSKALRVLEEVIASYARLSIEISFLIQPLAKIFMRTGRPVEAEALLRKLLGPEDSLGQAGPTPQPSVAITTMSADANEALAVFLAQPGPPEIDLEQRVEVLNLLAEALILQGRYEEAEELLDRALELTGELPPEHPDQWRTRTTLGRALRLQGRRREARAALESASARAKAGGVGESHADYTLIVEELARVEQPTEVATVATG
jgi:tetratricopeptide (TPR) repeat protein